MWVLIIVVVLNGKIHLDARPMTDKWACQQQEKELVAAASRVGEIAIATRCKELKVV